MKWIAVLVTVLMVSTAAAQKLEISLTQPDTVRLDWEAIPGQTYHVETTTDLVAGPWTDLTPEGFVAVNVLGAFSQPITDAKRFFRIFKEDTNPPEVVELLPGADAIAVASDAPVSIVLTDETGVDSSSIVLSVASWMDMTIAGGEITYVDDTIAFTPPATLGNPGAVITSTLTVADTLGHTLSDYTWTFQLARTIDATDDFLPLSAPPDEGMKTTSDGRAMVRTLPNVQPPAGVDEYYIVDVTEDTVVFSYTGDPPVIPVGRRLVSFDAAHPFYGEAVSSQTDTGQQLITVTTTDLNLTDLVSAGSLSSAEFTSAEPMQMDGVTSTGGLNLLHVEFGDDLSGTVLYEDSGLKVHLPSASWRFVGDVDVALDLYWFSLRSLDASASGTLTLDLTPEAIFYMAISGGDSVPLVPPVTHIFGGMAGPIPVWVEVIMELNAGFTYNASVSGNASTTVHAGKELTLSVRLRDGDWSHNVYDPPFVWEADPITWNLEGTANVKVYVQPKLTVLVYSLAGLWADIKPYVEMDGWYQLNPLEWDYAVYLGISSSWGITTRIPGLPEPPPWELFDYREPIWEDSYSAGPTGEAPEFVAPFPDRTVVVGNNLTLSGHASGIPSPSYQWYYNGSRITGATSAEYVIAPAQFGHAGIYRVEAYNSSGSVETSCEVSVVPQSPSGMVFIPGGEFEMGDHYGVGHSDELPLHDVNVSSFYIDRFEVSNQKYCDYLNSALSQGEIEVRNGGDVYAVGGNDIYCQSDETDSDSRISWNGSTFTMESSKEYHPMVEVSWYGSAAYCNWRSEGEGLESCYNLSTWTCDFSKNGYRLPTEAEWEYAARGGQHDPYYMYPWGNGIDGSRANYANSGDPYESGPYPWTTPVGFYPSNGYGIYDTSGNVYEWCNDRYSSSYYGLSPYNNPQGPGTGIYRVLRGGGWSRDPVLVRSANRGYDALPSLTDRYYGFRCAKSSDTVGGMADMAFTPAGSFQMGDSFNDSASWLGERPVHSVYVSAFYMDRYPVTKPRWDEVYTWAVANGYSFDSAGSGKAEDHPVHTVSWYDAVKWCNARSEKEGLTHAYYTSSEKSPATVYRSGRVDVQNDWVRWDTGYRLPTEAEWEKAARGGLSGRRFPWGDTIQHARANYYSDSSYLYDTSPTRGYHPAYNDGVPPYTSPVGDFAPNGYGLYDMAGNVWEWCWDWYSLSYYSSSPYNNPTGPASASYRVKRGGNYANGVYDVRLAHRNADPPTRTNFVSGFRCARSSE